MQDKGIGGSRLGIYIKTSTVLNEMQKQKQLQAAWAMNELHTFLGLKAVLFHHDTK